MGGKIYKFKKNRPWPHKRSEGLTRRGELRQMRLMLGPLGKRIDKKRIYEETGDCRRS